MIAELVKAHINCNLGIYFDSDSAVGGDVRVAYSRSITDGYWNFAYCTDASEFDTHQREIATTELTRIGRTPVIWQPKPTTTPPNWTALSEEVWMIATVDNLSTRTVGVEVVGHDRPTAQMRMIFEDAYGTGGGVDDVGYFALPPEYGDRYANGAATWPARMKCFEAVTQGRCVAVATIVVDGNRAGLYSVGTAHEARGNGYGSSVSQAAAQWAFRQGVESIFLQTEPDSPVEAMYQRVGFVRQFVGSLLISESR